MKAYFTNRTNIIGWIGIFAFFWVVSAVILALPDDTSITIDNHHYHIFEKEVEVVKYVEHGMPTWKMVAFLNPRVDPSIAKEIGKAVDENSKKHQLPKKLILSIIYKESTFNPLAKSKVAYGLMQIYPKYHKAKIKEMGITDLRELYHIDKNIDLGCWIFKEYLDKSKGELDEAFHRYVSKSATEAFKNKYKGVILTIWANLEFYEYNNKKEKA